MGASGRGQNSRRDWKAIMRGELSPPRPTPRRPVGGEVVYVRAPKPVWVAGFAGDAGENHAREREIGVVENVEELGFDAQLHVLA